jgi:hypothetical protein
MVFLLTPTSESVISKIENVFEDQVDVLLNGCGSMSVTLKTRSSVRAKDGLQERFPQRTYRFPGKTAEEAWRFSNTLLRYLLVIY